jgi:hypothetical protein
VRIGLIAPPWIPTPPPAYGGIERVVALQAAGMAAAGHQVTLVAAPGSVVPGVRVVSPLEHLPSQIGLATDEWRHVLGAMEELAGVDMVFDHSGPLGAMLSAQSPTPSMHVVHGSLETELLGLYEGLFTRAPALRLAAISRSQRRAAPHLPFVGVCHNAVDVDETPFRAESEGYLAFLGRMARRRASRTRSGWPEGLDGGCSSPRSVASRRNGSTSTRRWPRSWARTWSTSAS